MGWRHFDHTADVGLEAEGPDREAALEQAALALGALLVPDPAVVEPKEHRSLTVTGAETELLLFDLLDALRWLFESERWIWCRVGITTSETAAAGPEAGAAVELSVALSGEPWSPERHGLAHEVKAITYHDLALTPLDSGVWHARAIVDL
jgi:SHS2 domain-containing protein